MKTKGKSKTPARQTKVDAQAGASKARAILYTGGLIALALAVILLSSVLLPRLQFIEDLREGGLTAIPHAPGAFSPELGAELGGFLLLRLILSAVNIVLAVYLLYVYLQDYLRVKTSFTLGLVAFLFSFLLYALASFPPLHFIFGVRAFAEVFAFIPLLFSAIGLLAFVKLSNE